MKLIDPVTGQAVWDSNDPNAGPVPPAPEGREWVRLDEPGDTMAPRRTAPGILDIGNGVTERLAFLNQTFNPVEGIGSAMRAGSRMMAPDQSYWDRIASLGEMASGVASIAAPIAAAKAIGVPAASAMMEGLLGLSPARQAAGDMATQFARSESGALPGMGRGRPSLDVSRRDASNIFGAGSERVRYTDPQSGGTIEVVVRPDGSASVLELEVPEASRGQGIGQTLQERVMQDFPVMGGQVSSKAAATTAYRLGRRPPGKPAATLEEVFADIDEMSSVNMVSPAMQERLAPAAPSSFRLYQGSPHDFAAERLVRMPDGSTQYIVGSPNVLPDVPPGAEVLRDFPLGRQRMDKIGTGEGAQAYGYGLYGAENEAIARSYRDALAGTALPSGDPVSNAWDMIHRVGGNDPQMRSMIRESFVDMMEDADPKTAEFARQSVEAIDSGAVDAFKAPGHMYELEVNANPEDFLDWDLPLSEQPQAVRDALDATLPAEYDLGPVQEYRNFSIRNVKGPRGSNPIGSVRQQGETFTAFYDGAEIGKFETEADAFNAVSRADGGRESITGATAYNLMSREMGSLDWPIGADAATRQQFYGQGAANASQALREAGVPGIRYLDAGSRGAGEGSRNYVVFDENLINIVRKYGIAGAATMLGVSAFDVEQALAENMSPSQWDQLVVGPQ